MSQMGDEPEDQSIFRAHALLAGICARVVAALWVAMSLWDEEGHHIYQGVSGE